MKFERCRAMPENGSSTALGSILVLVLSVSVSVVVVFTDNSAVLRCRDIWGLGL